MELNQTLQVPDQDPDKPAAALQPTIHGVLHLFLKAARWPDGHLRIKGARCWAAAAVRTCACVCACAAWVGRVGGQAAGAGRSCCRLAGVHHAAAPTWRRGAATLRAVLCCAAGFVFVEVTRFPPNWEPIMLSVGGWAAGAGC
mgnify:CR=1 FL=1